MPGKTLVIGYWIPYSYFDSENTKNILLYIIIVSYSSIYCICIGILT